MTYAGYKESRGFRKACPTHQVHFHLLDGLIRDGQSQLLLRNRKVQPQLPPRVEAVLCCCEGWVGRLDGGRTAEEKRWAISLLA